MCLIQVICYGFFSINCTPSHIFLSNSIEGTEIKGGIWIPTIIDCINERANYGEWKKALYDAIERGKRFFITRTEETRFK